ncbi:MAG: M1 family metallopeptidase, partial [Acidimicrobiales bacterium]|nr:M1 family metallopeptidase [Acidimicrobiales bacterium]MYG62837.1 M1 family metallopeptidase [Acidimicrobiales bacterium]
VHQGHCPLDNAQAIHDGVVGAQQHIHHRIPDAHHIKRLPQAHARGLSTCARPLARQERPDATAVEAAGNSATLRPAGSLVAEFPAASAAGAPVCSTSQAVGSVRAVTLLTDGSPNANPYRLPRDVRPDRYDIVIEPDLDAARFVGEVHIEATVHAPIDSVTLNAAELECSDVMLSQDGTTSGAEISFDAETERMTLRPADGRRLEPGNLRISCTFAGELNDQLRGFYRSTFVDEAGEAHTIATTQFESTNARRAFPCFDEPDFKAVFGVTMIVPADLMAVSCGEVVSSEILADGRRRDTFADTMQMSTYLMAFIVGDLEATEPIDVGGVPLRIVHVRGKSALTGFGLEAGAFALAWLVDYYGIGYPGTKVDLIAVPDFAFGAMENMGAITFRETLLLADPQKATTAELLRIVDVVAHELAHMWFGNLVTMDWWNGIWLKEAFATFMQVAATDAFRPEWKRWDEFSIERGAAFDVDALSTTRPVEYEVVSPADAEGMYDVLTYEKGAAVVRMLEQYLGPDRFAAGVHNYLERHSYANTTTTDLWDALETSSGEPVRTVMDGWIFTGGYPIVSVEPHPSGLTLSQHRFVYGTARSGADAAGPGGPGAGGQGSAVWSVPVMVRARLADGRTVTERLLLSDATANVDLGGTVEWAVVNAGGHGYYRVRYSAGLLAAVARQALEVLEPIERYGLVDDTYAAVVAGDASAAEFIGLVTDLGSETDLHVWQRTIGGLKGLHAIAEPDGREALSVLIRDLATTALGVLGFEPQPGEPDLDRELRGVLFEAAGGRGRDELVRARARAIFENTTDSGDAVEPNLAAAAVQVVAAAGDETDYGRMLELYRSADTPQSELRYLQSLLLFEDAALFKRTLELFAAEVRTQNAPYLLGAAMTHLDHGPAAWAFIRDRWDELTDRFPQNSISRMAGGIRGLHTRELAGEVDAFFAEHEVPQGALTLAQHIEKMWVNVRLREREGARIGPDPAAPAS